MAFALPAEWSTAVRDLKPIQLLLLHELAHLLCVNKNHATEFRTEIVRRRKSIPHATALQRTFVELYLPANVVN